MRTHALLIALFAAIWTLTGPAANAGDISRDDIVRALKGETDDLSRSFVTPGLRIVDPAERAIDLNILFELDSAVLSPAARSQLEELAAALEDPDLVRSRISIGGHTDAHGSETYNLGLSMRRAEAVRDFLAGEYGIEAERLDVVGYGQERLKFPDDPFSGANRRVEISNLGG